MSNERKQFGRRGATPTPRFAGPSNSSSQMGKMASTGPSSMALGADDFQFGMDMSTEAPPSLLGMVFGFSGRIGRSTYWTIGAFRFLLTVALFVALAFNLPAGIENWNVLEFYGYFFGTAEGLKYGIPFIPLTVCYWSLEARRIHDRGHSALWLLLLFVPLVGLFYSLYLFIANGFFAGTPGRNAFG